jgi:hypothetical protein
MRGPRPGPALLLLLLLLASGTAVSPQEGPAAETSETAEGPEQVPASGQIPVSGEAPEQDPALGEASGESPAPELAPELSPEQKIQDMDIRTSSLIELAAWCRSLGLSEAGGREELAARLRAHFGILPQAAAAEGEEGQLIIIESARTTEYFTLEAVDEEYARLRGGVVINLTSKDATHRIQAQEILYNRTRNVMTASGGVEYVREEGDTVETFRGESITVNLDSWASVFSDSVSERSLSGDGTTYRFAGSLITRSSEEATVLTDAVITNASTDEPLWSISASKLWLLPGSDFAIFNAVLKVGAIPLLWFPVFFWPADEVVFHPVFGTRTREGSFLQTTTYILGRPKNTGGTESSITKILGSGAGMEQRREGIFLRSTGKRQQNAEETQLALFLDIYANLGVFLGMNLSMPGRSPLGPLEFAGGIGLTRNVYLPENTPFPNMDGESEWNRSRFLSFSWPLRYRFDTSGSLSGSLGSLSWKFPYHSDPLVDRDFMRRSESMDWMKMLQQGSAEDTDDASLTLGGTYEWQLSGSFNPRLQFLAPVVTELYLSNISSNLHFGLASPNPLPQGISSRALPELSPDRYYYYPESLTIASVSAVLRGTPLQLRQRGQSAASGTGGAPPASTEDPLAGIGIIPSPFETAENPEEAPPEGSSDPAALYALVPPALSAQFELPRLGDAALTWAYQANPSFSSTLGFRYGEWNNSEDVSWDEASSVLTSVRADGSTSITLSDSVTSLYNLNLQVSGNLAWQDYSYMDEAALGFATIAERNDKWRRVYNARSFSTTGQSALTLKPLYFSPVWANTSVQYTVRGLIAKSAYRDPLSTSATVPLEDPIYDIEWGEWTKERMELHQVSATFSASVMDKTQSLSVTTSLPPEDTYITGNAVFRIWISETTITERIMEPFDDELRVFEPLTITESFTFAPRYSLQGRLTYDPKLEEFTWLSSTLTLAGFNASFTMSRAMTYKLVRNAADTRWEWSNQEERFSARDIRLNYQETFRKSDLWGGRFSFEINTGAGLSLDLQRYTSSRFTFRLGLTLKVAEFLDLSVSTNSENARIFRYLQNLPFFDFPAQLPGETNVLVDLLNSFRFDSTELRRSSGFVLKSFTLNAVHHLGDWTATLGITLSPYLDTASSTYRFNNQISFLVQWIPIPEIKTDVQYDKEVWTKR